MELALSLKNDYLLDTKEKYDLDEQINKIIEEHKNNAYQINQLVFDSVNALTINEARCNELQGQSPLKKFFSCLTGKNGKLQSEIHKNLARAQYCSQQTIQKLAEQNLMSFELITAINNKLNSSIIEIDNEINNIYGALITFFKQTKSDIIRIENRLDKVEQNVNLLNWMNSIEYQMVDGVEYSELDEMEKILRIAIDFYEITNGVWNTSELLLLKSAVANVGLLPKDYISYMEFIKFICKNDDFYMMFIKIPFENIEQMKDSRSILINCIGKYKILDFDDKYVIESINDILNRNDIKNFEDNIKEKLITKYGEEKYNIDLKRNMPIFDFVLELLFDIRILKEEINNIDYTVDYCDMEISKMLEYEKMGFIRAQHLIGYSQLYGIKMEQNIEEGIERLTLNAKDGNIDSIWSLQFYYFNDKKDYKKVEEFSLLMLDKEKYDKFYIRNAQCNLGQIYYEGGYGIEQNYEKALKWFKLAAKNGDTISKRILGDIYYNGNGVQQDYEEALFWYKAAAEEDDSIAQNTLGNMYYNGTGTQKNYLKATKWYNLATEGEYPSIYAANNLGNAYYVGGYGIERDYIEAVKWYEK